MIIRVSRYVFNCPISIKLFVTKINDREVESIGPNAALARAILVSSCNDSGVTNTRQNNQSCLNQNDAATLLQSLESPITGSLILAVKRFDQPSKNILSPQQPSAKNYNVHRSHRPDIPKRTIMNVQPQEKTPHFATNRKKMDGHTPADTPNILPLGQKLQSHHSFSTVQEINGILRPVSINSHHIGEELKHSTAAREQQLHRQSQIVQPRSHVIKEYPQLKIPQQSIQKYIAPQGQQSSEGSNGNDNGSPLSSQQGRVSICCWLC